MKGLIYIIVVGIGAYAAADLPAVQRIVLSFLVGGGWALGLWGLSR